MPSLRSVLPYSALLVLLLSSSPVHGYTPGKVGGTGPASSSPKAQPGFCVVPADCKVEGYECVALQTTRPGTEDVKQCLPKKQDTDVCAGQFPGLCPSFASWADPYKQISSVCTYKPAKKCALDPTGESVKGEVVCVPGAKDDNGKELSVIYGCVDIDITAKKVGFTDREDAGKLAKTLGTADAVINACLNTNASATATNVLCSGHGTCLMKNAGTIKYECRCNIGYSGDFCDKKDSNKCALPGQCSAGQCNLEKQVCECPAGTTGNQCADCDASSPNACNGNGKCTNKQCVCDSGFLGDHCDQKPKPKPTATSAASSSNSTSGGSSVGANSTAGNAAAPRAGSLAASGMAAVVVVLIAALH